MRQEVSLSNSLVEKLGKETYMKKCSLILRVHEHETLRLQEGRKFGLEKVGNTRFDKIVASL